MANKTITWSPRAQKELRSILEFFNHRNRTTNYSEKILREIEKQISLIQLNPNIGRVTNDTKIRVLPMKVYLLFYEIAENEIFILSFWDNRQKLKNRLY